MITSSQQIVDEIFYEKYLKQNLETVSPPRYFSMMGCIGNDKDLEIVDIGTGAGDLLFLLKKNGYKNIIGVDYSKVAIKYAEKKGIKMIYANIEEPDFLKKVGGKYDVVLLGEVLEHIFDPKRVMSILKSLLTDNGTLIISVPNAGWFINGFLLTFFPQFLRISPAFGVWTHVNQFTAYSIKNLLENNGFQVKVIKGTGYWMMKAKKRALLRTFIVTISKLPITLTNLLANVFPSIFSSQLIIVSTKK